MFGKDVSSAGDSKLNSIIGKGSQYEGEIVVAGGLKIDGTFKGKIKADSVFVGKEAVIEATVDTNVAVVGGKVLGDVTARESLELQAKSELVGNVITKNLIVGESAILDGYCDMGQKERHAKKDAEKKPSGEPAKPAAPAASPGHGSAIPASAPSRQTDKN
ncbi:MAG TPA: polymer-forming cytoskeletal protein [bacterium]|nr:polymer-forming cytoskeletal protein [bacterium]